MKQYYSAKYDLVTQSVNKKAISLLCNDSATLKSNASMSTCTKYCVLLCQSFLANLLSTFGQIFTSFSTSSLVPFLQWCKGVCMGLWDCVPSSAKPYTDCGIEMRGERKWRKTYYFPAMIRYNNRKPQWIVL